MTKFSSGGIINKLIENSTIQDALVAQLDRVTGYEPVGRGFESLQARQKKKDTAFAVSFFFWCACPRRRRAMRSPLRDAGNEPVARFGAQFHWNVFLTHSTSSARGRRAVCLFLWEIKLRRKRRRCLKQRLFCFGEGELEISFCTIQPPRGRKCGLLCSIFLIARLLLDAAILQNDDAVGVLEEIDAVGDGDDR